MQVDALSAAAFEELAAQALDIYVQCCQEILYEQDRFLYRKLAALHRSGEYELQVELADAAGLAGHPDYGAELDDSYYVALVRLTAAGPAGEEAPPLEVARLVLSQDPGRERFVEFLLS